LAKKLRERAVLAGIFSFAFLLRLLPVFVFRGINFPDEIFQTIEQAHRLVYGYGLVPWEFEPQNAVRSWIFPGALAGMMEACRHLDGGSGCYLPLTGIALAFVSAASVLCCALWGRRFFGLNGAVLAGATAAFWLDGIYFGPRTLSEVFAAHLMVIGFYLLDSAADRWTHGRATSISVQLAIGGFLLGTTLMLRIQTAVAIACFVLWPTALPMRKRVALLDGFVVALLLSGLLDSLTWDYPFEPVWKSFAENLLKGVAAANGEQPWYQYVAWMIQYWGGAGAVLVAALAVIGAMRMPQLATAGLLIIVSHSVIGHKEYRFIYPALLLINASAGLGFSQTMTWIMRGVAGSPALGRSTPSAVMIVGCVLPIAASVAQFTTSDYTALWERGRSELAASDFIGRMSAVCGIASYGLPWTGTGGFTHFHQAVRYYAPVDEKEFANDLPAFNVLLYARPPTSLSPFQEVKCFDGTCVAFREGTCTPLPIARYPLQGVFSTAR
jgi:hypothetical protein